MRRLIAALACIWFALLLTQAGSAQSLLEKLVSPGELANPHAKFEATCSSCHASFDKAAQSAKCRDCHTDTSLDIRNKRGFHGRSPQVAGAECKTCHTDHKGRTAVIIQFDPKAFNHRFTDFPLEGGHLSVDCADCHKTGEKQRKTPTDCAGCHTDDEPHNGQLGASCASCHVVASWTTVSFDHATTAFALIGAHGKVECMACHEGEVWKGLRTTCASCHAKDDVHKGSLGVNCASCHSEQSWTVSQFDHVQTGFRLVGAHAKADCQTCHKGALGDPLPRDCNGCHVRDDVHKGDNGANCESCHSSSTWTAITFDHDSTKLPLLGKHRTAKCETCHTKPITSWEPPVTCIGCHEREDKHKGLLGPDCKDCHAEKSWAQVRFDHAKDAKFALEGKHSAAECAACHLSPTSVKSPPVSCIGCHREEDPHKGQLGDGCGRCHGEADWKTNVRFDHGLTDFPLLGKHAKVGCKDCHATPAYLDARATCVSCHQKEDVHKGRLGTDCASCHNPADWSRWRFDHAVDTDYPLTGRHVAAPCASCHRVAVKQKIELSTRCISCHAGDDKHRGSFGTNCERCHTTEAFWAVDVGR